MSPHSKSSRPKRIAQKLLDSLQDMDENGEPIEALDIIQKAIMNLPAAVVSVLQEERRLEKRQHIPEKVRKAVLMRDKHQCSYCKSKHALELHHYIFVCQGGKNTTDNLITLCAICHARVHAKEIKIRKPRGVPVE